VTLSLGTLDDVGFIVQSPMRRAASSQKRIGDGERGEPSPAASVDKIFNRSRPMPQKSGACSEVAPPFYPRPPSMPDNAPINRTEFSMPTFQIVFIVTLALTVSSGIAATSIVVFGDTRRNIGQRNVAEKLVQIALLGAAAIISLLALH
jgi:hypothetical protein